MNKRGIARSLTLLGLGVGLVICVLPGDAQTRIPMSRGGSGGRQTVVARPRHRGRFFAGPVSAPYFYPDYDSEPEATETPAPQITVAQAAPPALATASPPRNPGESLVLELQGDHWVRITNNGQTQDLGAAQRKEAGDPNAPSGIATAKAREAQLVEPASKLPPAVLVFRDGHQEEIGRYVVIGTTIHIGADYWTGGSWAREIQISELDVPATLKLNEGRGAKFSLPTAPNEVMIRP